MQCDGYIGQNADGLNVCNACTDFSLPGDHTCTQCDIRGCISCDSFAHGGTCSVCGEVGCLDSACDSASYRALRESDGLYVCQSCLAFGECTVCDEGGCHANGCSSTSYFDSDTKRCIPCTTFGDGEDGTAVCTSCSREGGCAYGTLNACDAEGYVTDSAPHICRSCEDFGNGLDGAGRCIICNAVQGCIEETGCFRGSYFTQQPGDVGRCNSCSEFDDVDGVGSCQHCAADACLICGDYSYLTDDGLCHSCGQFDAEDFVNGDEIGRCLNCNDNGGTLMCSHCENGYFYDSIQRSCTTCARYDGHSYCHSCNEDQCFDCGEGFSYHETFKTCQPCNRFNSNDGVATCTKCATDHCKNEGCVVDSFADTAMSYGWSPHDFGKCSECEVKFCTRCPDSTCKQCEENYLLTALNFCLYKCSETTDHAECNSHPSCVSHYDGYACRSCRDEFDAHDDHGECVECSTAGCTMRVCFHGYFHAGNGVCEECSGVDQNCAICVGQGEGETPECVRCIGGYRYVSGTKKCKLENPTAFGGCPYEEDMSGHSVQYRSNDWMSENYIRRGHACITPGQSIIDLKAQGVLVCGCPYKAKCGKTSAQTIVDGAPLNYMKYYCQASNFNPYESYVQIVYNYHPDQF